MSSLWTPDGERRIPPADNSGLKAQSGEASQPSPGDSLTSPPGGADFAGAEAGQMDREQAERELQEVRSQLLSVPAEAVVANHCYGLFELAALHLSQPTPSLDASRLAIDALAALVEGLAGRLGAEEGTMKEGLVQLRLAWVQVQAAVQAANAAGHQENSRPAGNREAGDREA